MTIILISMTRLKVKLTLPLCRAIDCVGGGGDGGEGGFRNRRNRRIDIRQRSNDLNPKNNTLLVSIIEKEREREREKIADQLLVRPL